MYTMLLFLVLVESPQGVKVVNVLQKQTAMVGIDLDIGTHFIGDLWHNSMLYAVTPLIIGH